MQRITSGQGATDLGTATGEGVTPPLASQVNREAGIQHDGDPGDQLPKDPPDRSGLKFGTGFVKADPEFPQEQETVRRRGSSAEYDVAPTLWWLLQKAGDEWGPLGVAKAAAFMAGHHVVPGIDV